MAEETWGGYTFEWWDDPNYPGGGFWQLKGDGTHTVQYSSVTGVNNINKPVITVDPKALNIGGTPSGGGISYGEVQTDADGSVTGVAGAKYQRGSNGSVNVIYRPGADKSVDANGDGYDDNTGLPNGVTIIGGKPYYQGKEVNPDGSLKEDTGPKYGTTTVERDGVQYVYALNADGTLGAQLYAKTDPNKASNSGGGGGVGGGASIVYKQFGAGGKGAPVEQGGGNQMSASERIALINAKVNAAKAYAESLMVYDPNQYSAFLGAAGGNLANAISSGGNALSARALKPSQDILGQIKELDRQLGTRTDLSSAGDLSGGYFGQAAMPRYAYGTAPGVMRNAGGLSNGGNQFGNGGRPADYVPLTPTQQYEQRILRAYNMTHFPKATSIGDIPYTALSRLRAGLATSEANAKARIAAMNAQQPVVRWNADYTFGTYVDSNGKTHSGPPEYIKQFVDADRQKQRALSLMTPAERLIYEQSQPKQQPAMAFGTWGLGNYGGGDGTVAAAKTQADQAVVDANFQNFLAAQRFANKDVMGLNSGSKAFKDWLDAQKPKTVPEVAADGTAMAYGGLSTARMAIVGDPQKDGGPNPEIIYNPTGAPFSVTPMKNVVPLYAYGTPTPDPYKADGESKDGTTGYKTGSEGRNRFGGLNGQAPTEDPETTRLRAQYPWMNDPNYFMNVEFWKQDPILRDLYLKGLQMNKGISMASVLASAEQNRLGGVSSNQMQVGW